MPIREKLHFQRWPKTGLPSRTNWPRLIAWRIFGVCFLLTASHLYAQSLETARQDFLHGKYSEVIETAQKNINLSVFRDDWRRLLVKLLLQVGRYDEAYTNAAGFGGYAGNMAYAPGPGGDSGNIASLLLKREAALYHNDPTGANRQLAGIKLILEQHPPGYQSGEELVAVGRALLLLGVEPRLVLENCFQRAENLNAPPREAFLAGGQLALDKHDFKLAADAFRAGLQKFPNDPDLLAGLAEAFEPSDRETMAGLIDSALAQNPKHMQSLLLLVDHLIDAEQYDEAEKQLAIVLGVNPHQPNALAFRAVLAELRNDHAAAQQFRADALKFYRTNPEVDYVIGRKLSQKYRFAEGAAAQRRALDFDPDYLPARRQLAEDLLRLGKDGEGWQLAEAVHQEDAYDVTAYNLVTLHDQMVKYATVSNADFIVHMTPHEATIYGDQALDLLNRAKAVLCPKYGVELTQPTAVEIFPEQKDFAVRTFGMPGNPGYLGVCFGSVITANSPASQAPNPANWKDVLWHEFCHVVTLTATRNRMPRWLSEGISVYEERQADPTWGDRMNLAFRETILNGGLTPLGKLSGAFLAPSNSMSLQFAYYESSLAVEFIVQKFGFETLKKILADLRAGDVLNDSIAKRTTPLPELEKQFAAFARDQAGQLAPGADLERPPDRQSEADQMIWNAAHPENYYLRRQKAADLMEAKRWADAKPALESLAESYHGEKGAENPLWLLSVTERNLNETNAELATLQKFAAQESDFVPLFARLINLSEARGDWPAVASYADRLLAINPLTSLPHDALAKAGVAIGKRDLSITSYRKLLLLDPPDPTEIHFQLASLLHARGNSESEAKRQVLQALEEAPRFRDAQKLLLELTEKTSQPKAGATTSKPRESP